MHMYVFFFFCFFLYDLLWGHQWNNSLFFAAVKNVSIIVGCRVMFILCFLSAMKREGISALLENCDGLDVRERAWAHKPSIFSGVTEYSAACLSIQYKKFK